MGCPRKGATLLCLWYGRPIRRPPHQTGEPLHRGSPMQVVPPRLKDGLARGESRLAHRQDGTHRRPECDDSQRIL